jgi:site-specific recombinase XerC
MAYAARTRRPPRTLTDEEVSRVLRVSGENKRDFRDHLILSFALGSGLRESEIVALDVEDVCKPTDKGRLLPRRTLQLRVFKRGAGKSDPSAQRVPVTDSTYYKLQKYLNTVAPLAGALFRSRKGNARLSTKAVRTLFKKWQQRAGFDHLYSFHHLRHTSLTNMYRKTRDVRLVQRFARHANINTTTLYEHASDEEVQRAARGLAS